MNRLGAILLTGVIMLAAGCSGAPFMDNGQTSTPAQTKTVDPVETATSTQPIYTTETNTDEIVLRLSDIGGSYNLSGSSVATPSGSSIGANESNIVKEQSRSFRLTNLSQTRNRPLLIISTATIFSDSNLADKDIGERTSSLQERGASVRTITVARGIEATLVQFENDRGLKNTILYYQDKNLVLSVIVSGRERYHTDSGEEFLVIMYSDLPNSR